MMVLALRTTPESILTKPELCISCALFLNSKSCCLR